MSASERYRVLDRIGAGGLGVVYRVEDQATHEIVAMKVMPRARGTANLKSEFLSLARIHHDNVVRVFDYGLTESGHDYFTMELVEGPPLAEAAADVGSPRFYRLIGGILRGLALVHARDVVHADIKPSNILVNGRLVDSEPERAAKLADFGLAAAVEDASSTVARGTFPYAAPEVYAGRLDARSDLYSLGVVLYELVCGIEPYRGAGVREVLAAQRRAAPEDPRAHAPDLPAELAELVVALCDPAPGARPQTADEVLARINDIAGTDFDIADSLPLLDFSSVLVGRERDLSALQRAWGETRAGRGGAVLVCGEEGIGKSRLATELELFVQLDGGKTFEVEVGRDRETPYAGISSLVRALLASLGDPTADAGGDLRRALAPLLGGRGNAPPVDRASRFALAEAVTSVVLRLAAGHPMLITVDDAHLADPATVELLAYLARSVPDSSAMLLLTARTSPGADIPATDRLARAVRNAARGTRIDLPPIDQSSVFRLCEQAFGRELAIRLGDDLYRASGGNPAHATGALELLVAGGAVVRERGRWILGEDSPAITLPPTAQAAALARAQALPAATRRVIEAAAVIGDEFWRNVLAEVAPGVEHDEALDDALADAIAARVIRGDAGAGQFRFVHRATARGLVAALDDARRLDLHRRATNVYERLHAEGKLDSPVPLATHYGALGDRERTARWGLDAADECASRYDHHGALEWYQRVRPLLDDAEKAAVVDERIGDLASLVGDVGLARDSYRRAHDARASSPTDHIRLARRLGELERRQGAGDAALEILMSALGEARSARLPEEEALCHLRIGWVLMYRADYTAATEHTVAGQLIARSRGDRVTSAELGRLRAAIDIYQGDTRSALEHLESALADAESTGDDLLVAGVLHEIGRAAIHAGDYARAIDALEKAIPATERVGHIEQAAKSLNNLGAAYYFQGDWERARPSWERFRRLCERLDEQSELVNALNNLGSLYREMGQFGDALQCLDRGAEVATLTGHAHMGAMIQGNRGEVLFRQGDLAGARRCYDAALAVFERIHAREDEIENRRRLCEVDLAAGRVTAALDRAIDIAREAKDAGALREEGIVHRVAAHALRLNGDLESASWFIDRAREILGGLGARYERAKVELEAAEIAAARAHTQDAEKHLQAAIDGFAALGARWDLGVARGRKRAVAPAAVRTGRGEQTEALQLLLELSQAVARVDVDRLLEMALDKILDITRFERGFILLLDDEGRPREKLRRVRPGARGFAPDEAEFSGTIVRRVAASGQAAMVRDIAEEAELREQKSVVALGLRQIMCAPMRAHGRVIGIVYIDSRRIDLEEHPVDLILLEACAAQVAVALENAHLVAQEKKQSELMAILAHEIRNPLAGILGYADIGETEGEAESLGFTEDELFTRIHRDAERLRRLVDNVLELTRHESGNVEWSMGPFDIGELVRDVVATYHPVCDQKGIRIRCDTLGGIVALGNPDRIMQVLSNLVNNAVKFTPAGGAIALRAQIESVAASDPTAPPFLATTGAWAPTDLEEDATQEFVRVDVVDSGPGMSPEIRDRLFQKFTQGASKKTSGIGLGLYISREIINRHGGSIFVESELGEGATFSFRIPLA